MTPNPCLSPSPRPRFGRFSLVLSFVSSLALAGSAVAQEAKDNPPAAVQRLDSAQPVQADDVVTGATINLEKLVVTGTSIRGIPVASAPAVKLDFAQIQATGVTTTMDLVATVPQFSNFASTPGVNQTVGLLATVPQIHGLGTAAVLVLVDSHRMAGTGFVTNLPDPANVPISAIERVEIVTDGSSAIYGSDAVAGVVNIITRKNFQGTQVSLSYGTGADYSKHNFSLITGKGWDTGSFTFSYENMWHSNLLGLNRNSFASYNQTARGGHDFRLNFASPGTVVIGGVNYALPSLAPNTQNLFDPSGYTDIYPKEERNSGMLNFRQKLGDRVEVYAQAFLSKKKFEQRFSQTTMTLTVNNTNPYFVAPAGTGATAETVKYWFGKELGPSNLTFINTRTSGLTAGLTVDLGHGWTAEAVGTFGSGLDSEFVQGLDQVAATAAAAGTTTATALNVFGVGPATDPAVIATLGGANYANPYVIDTQAITQAQLKFDGPLFKLPAGDVKAAIGGESFATSFTSDTTYGVPNTGKATSTHYDAYRRVTAAYAELFLPLFGDANALPGLKKLDLSVAGRINQYSDGGTTKTPKLGLTWTPTKGITLRGSYGKSFVAPNLWQQHSPDIAQVVNIGGLNTLATTGGNSNLVPQTATTYSAGLVLFPRNIPRLNISVDYFDVDYKNLITIPLGLGGRLFSDPGLSAKYLIYFPTAAQVAAVTNAMPVNGVIPAGGIQLILETRANNVLSQKVRGFDFAVDYTIKSSVGDIVPRLAGSTFTQFYSGVPTAPLPSVLNTNAAIRWKARASLEWKKKPFDATVFVNYTDSYDNTGAPYTAAAPQKVSSNKTIDLHVIYSLPKIGWLVNSQVELDVQNLLDKNPPFFEVTPSTLYPTGYDGTVASPLGRVVSLAVRKQF